jgi:hypothetical protein
LTYSGLHINSCCLCLCYWFHMQFHLPALLVVSSGRFQSLICCKKYTKTLGSYKIANLSKWQA